MPSAKIKAYLCLCFHKCKMLVSHDAAHFVNFVSSQKNGERFVSLKKVRPC